MPSTNDPWPMEYAGIQLLPPLVYCPTHKKWEGYDESIPGLCDYCCLVAPCPLGHDRGEGFGDEEDAIADAEWRARQERRRHKTGAVQMTQESTRQTTIDEFLEMDYLDWSDES